MVIKEVMRLETDATVAVWIYCIAPGNPLFKHPVMLKKSICLLALVLGNSMILQADPSHKLLFFTKSSGFEHSVISWKGGKPSLAEKVFLDLGSKNTWEFEFSKDGSKSRAHGDRFARNERTDV